MKLLFTFLLLSSVCFGQNKKEQIEILNFRVDSLNTVLATTRDNSAKDIRVLNDKIKEVRDEVTTLQISNTNLTKENDKLKTDLTGATGITGATGAQGIAIGDSYQGGIIFYLDGLGGGLIAAPTDQSSGAQWGCVGTTISGADGRAIGTGAQNTIDIEAGCSTAGTAADFCANLVLSGYTDWFLPSKNELNLMYLNIGQGNALGLGNVGGFANSIYWSSTENGSFSPGSSFSAWRQSFTNGTQGGNQKYNANYVRAVRAF